MERQSGVDIITFVEGCVIESDYVTLVSFPDAIDPHSVDFSRVFFYDGQEEENQRWAKRDFDWHVVSVCVWRHSPFGKRAYVTISREGNVEIECAGGDPVHIECIPDSGLHEDWSADYGYLNRVREIGTHLYACGDQRQVYRRDDMGNWVHFDQNILIPAAATIDELNTINADLMDIAGLSEDSIYAVGYGGEVFYYDGTAWRKIESGLDEQLLRIKILSEDAVYIIGANGSLLAGNYRDGFRNLSSVEDNQRFTGIEIFHNTIFLASNIGMFTYDEHTKRIAPYKTTLQPDLVDCHLLEAKDGVLWSIGFKDLAYFDGFTWTRIDHPDNPPIR